MGTFPGKPETNPKASCNVILESNDEPLVEANQMGIDKESVGIKKLVVEGDSSKEDQAMKKRLEDPREKFLKIIALVEKEERLELEALKAKGEAAKSRDSPKLKTLHKRENPGKFNISVSLGGRVFEDALCDSGSYANVISWDLVQELGIKGMQPHSTLLTFGDASKKLPKGIIEKFPVLVGDCVIESDLLVVDMVDSKKQPILLGAPFLLTTGAVIDYVSGVVTLTHIGDEARYTMVPTRVFVGTIIQGEATSQAIKTKGMKKSKVLKSEKVAKATKLEKEVPSFEEATSLVEANKVEVTSSLVMEMLDGGTTLENEEPLGTKVSSKGVEAVSFLDSGNFELEKLFEEEVLPKEAQKIKVAKGAKKKKLKQAQNDFQEARPYNLTFKPLTLVDGKLDCHVQCKGYSKPFHKVRILLDPTSRSKDDSSMVTSKMTNLFGMKLNDPGPFQGGSSTST